VEDDDRAMTLDWTEGGLAEGLRRYRAGEFFAAHEDWEDVWLGLKEPEKTFLQSLIQIAAALHHLQRGNQQGTKSLLKAALRRLDPYPASFGGISVTRLCEELREWVQALEAGDEVSELSFPQIQPHR
jgi:predicted metal-dependent hydrolase